MAKLTTAEFIEAIKELSVLELNDLVKACEEEFGVSAAAGVVVAAAGGEAAAAEEKTEFDVELTEVGPNKVKVIKVVREAEVAVHSILGKEDAMSYRAIPGVVYTNPEIAGVGETEESALAKGITYQVIKLPMAYSGRFVAENEGVNGVCKVLLNEQQRVIGAHVLGNPASEIITLAGTAIELGLTAAQWKKIVFPHPTVGEIFREVL